MQNNHAISTQHTSDSELQEMLGLAAGPTVNDFSADTFPDYDLDAFASPDQEPGAGDTSLSPPGDHQNAALPTVQPSIESPLNPGHTPDGDTDDNITPSGIGAGPLPTGYGVQLPSNTGSTLTDFTKRRNWSQRVVEEIKDFLHILSPDCRLMYVSPSAQSLTGHEPGDLVGKLMSTFIHPDDCGMYMREFNESIASGHSLRFFYRFRKADGSYTIFESHGHPHFSSDVSDIGGSGHSVAFCRGFFMMSRPYPTRNAGMLDSFLEHKIENERLKKRIADLKREEQEDSQQQFMGGPGYNNQGNHGRIYQSGSSASITPLDQPQGDLNYRRQSTSASGESLYPQQNHPQNNSGTFPASPTMNDYNGMPPPAKPSDANFALTQRNLDEALAASIPDSINDKMARFEGINHLEGIEMLTGLRYREGERSKGISTGAKSPALEHGSHDFPGMGSRHGSGGAGRAGGAAGNSSGNDATGEGRFSGSPGVFGDAERRKKMKVADEYVCTDCGTLDSPEWRRGPTGPKSLCNACGLRWAKQEKKKAKAADGGKGSKHKDHEGAEGGGAGNGNGNSNVNKGKLGVDIDMDHHMSHPVSPAYGLPMSNSTAPQPQLHLHTQLAIDSAAASNELDPMHQTMSGMSGGMPFATSASATSPMDMMGATDGNNMNGARSAMGSIGNGMNMGMGMGIGMGAAMTPQMQTQLQGQMHMHMAEQQARGGNGSNVQVQQHQHQHGHHGRNSTGEQQRR